MESLFDKVANVNDIYNRLADDESKSLYIAKVEYSIDRNLEKFIDKIRPYIKQPKRIKVLDDKIQEYDSDGFVIYGCGEYGRIVKKNLEAYGYRVKYFIDKKYGGETVLGIPVFYPEQIKEDKLGLIVIASKNYMDDMENNLLSLGVDINRIYKNKFGMVCSTNPDQYFDYFTPDGEEIFVDCGAFDGGSTKAFKFWSRNPDSKSFVFEPSKEEFLAIKNDFEKSKITNTVLYNMATWDSKTTLSFSENGSSSKIVEESNIKIEAFALDDIINEKVTFIKMDVEGAEIKSLEGAKNLIKKYRPRLAICIYHKYDDIFTIPSTILDIVPDYKFAIRHYSNWKWETVLYAY